MWAARCSAVFIESSKERARYTQSGGLRRYGSEIGRLVVNEHFVPEDGLGIEDYLARGERTAVHHLLRYKWATKVLVELGPGESILDIACGAGYGSHQLAENFPSADVTGADYDAAAVEFARATYPATNLSFTEADATRWDEAFGPRVFDRIVSFDTLEHIAHREVMMQGLIEHLAPDGLLLLSTPVKSQTVMHPGWEHHKIEFSRWALYDFLRRYFNEVLAPDFGTLPAVGLFKEINRDETVYLLKMNPVVCREPIRIARPE